LTPRPRPVVWYTAFVAGVSAFLGFAGLTDLMPKNVIAWVALVAAIVTAVGGSIVQSQVTPLSSPMDNDGNRLEPVPASSDKPTRADGAY
jgi:hypothetical protein